KRWEINDTTNTYTFYPRDDVWFHKHHLFGKDSTRKLVAEDFVYSLNRLKDPRVASPGSWVVSNVEHFSAVNDTVVEIRTSVPYPPLLGVLAMRYGCVVRGEAVERPDIRYRSSPAAAGPFAFRRWEGNSRRVFR